MPLGFLLVFSLNVDDAYARDDIAGVLMVVAALTYCSIPGFLISHRLGGFWLGRLAEVLIGPLGVIVAMTIHVLFTAEWLVPALVWWILIPATLLGFIFGLVGAAAAKPRDALQAIRDQRRVR